MEKIDSDSLSAILFEIKWSRNGIKHTDEYFAKSLNIWRDYLPGDIRESLIGKSPGQTLAFHLPPEEVIPPCEKRLIKQINLSQFDRNYQRSDALNPHYGRFYPKGVLRGLPNIFQCNFTPFRVVGIHDSTLKVNLNHPLADTPVQLSATIVKVMEKIDERGGTSHDWIQTVMEGPGMQARANSLPTDFFSEDPFARINDEPDSIFYSNPRMVTHIDDTAIQTVKDIYQRLLKSDTEILDLMSSWTSHMPEDVRFKKIAGLGLNKEELEANEQLTDHVVHDLNDDPKLPFKDNAYDGVVCTVSVEYLTRPFEVFEEVARILRPNGRFIVTFSNRWFPPKVVRIWQEIHEFERMGLVTEYFLKSGKYENIHTISTRGLKRPVQDKYYAENLIADPMYCVYGSKKV